MPLATLLTAILLAHTTYAADISFVTTKTDIGVGQQFEVVAILDSEGEMVNAYEAIVEIPDFLEVDSVTNGSSLITFWAKKPEFHDGVITFAGITPGGFNEKSGELFSAVLTSTAEGVGRLYVSDGRVLLHDGVGTEATLKTAPLTFVADSNIPVTEFIPAPDTNPPHAFAPELMSDPSIFDGEFVLVFDAKDDESGIAYYEAFEVNQLLESVSEAMWQRVSDPYLITDQSLQSVVYVRAVDGAGNTRMAVVDLSTTDEHLFDVLTDSVDAKTTKGRATLVVVTILLLLALLGITRLIISQIGKRQRRKLREEVSEYMDSEEKVTKDDI